MSALNSFFARAKQDAFPLLHDRTDLWRLLAKITVRKTIHQRHNAHAHNRANARAQPNSEQDLHDIAANEPTPAMLVAINEEFQRLLSGLRPDLQTVARMKLEGYTNREIAAELGRVERTVERKLGRIRRVWQMEVERS